MPCRSPGPGVWSENAPTRLKVGEKKIAVAETVATDGPIDFSPGEYQICFSAQLVCGSLLGYVSSSVCILLRLCNVYARPLWFSSLLSFGAAATHPNTRQRFCRLPGGMAKREHTRAEQMAPSGYFSSFLITLSQLLWSASRSKSWFCFLSHLFPASVVL